MKTEYLRRNQFSDIRSSEIAILYQSIMIHISLKLQQTLTVCDVYILQNSRTVPPQYVKKKRFLDLPGIAVSEEFQLKY